MGIPPATKRWSWDRPTREIWGELAEPEVTPDMPFFQKLALLVQLRAAQAGEDTARAVAGYTRWLVLLTGVIVLCTVVQTVFLALTYLHSPAH
jgi:hypothetical protein